MDNEEEDEQGDTSILGDGLEDLHIDSQLNTPSSNPSEEWSSVSRKRKRSNILDPLISSIKESVEIIGSTIAQATNTFSAVLGIERDREELRKGLNGEMKKIDGLTNRERNKAVRMLSRDEDLMVVFFTIEEEDKLGWVKDLLDD